MKIFENKLKTKRKQGYSNLPFSVSAMLGCRYNVTKVTNISLIPVTIVQFIQIKLSNICF